MPRKTGTMTLLDFSMEVQSILMNIKDRELQRKKIDELDDLRRDQKREREKQLLSEFDSLILLNDFDYLKDWKRKYDNFLISENEKEDFFEELDDTNREQTAKYLSEKIEDCKDSNENLNVQIICEKVNIKTSMPKGGKRK